jgi:hypothetical protein
MAAGPPQSTGKCQTSHEHRRLRLQHQHLFLVCVS